MRSFLEDIHDAGVTFDPTDDASMGEDSSYTGTSDSDDSNVHDDYIQRDIDRGHPENANEDHPLPLEEQIVVEHMPNPPQVEVEVEVQVQLDDPQVQLEDPRGQVEDPQDIEDDAEEEDDDEYRQIINSRYINTAVARAGLYERIESHPRASELILRIARSEILYIIRGDIDWTLLKHQIRTYPGMELGDSSGCHLLQSILRNNPPCDVIHEFIRIYPKSFISMDPFYVACQHASDEVVELLMNLTIQARQEENIRWSMVALLGDARLRLRHAKMLLKKSPHALIDPNHGIFNICPLDRMISGAFIHGDIKVWMNKLKLALQVAEFGSLDEEVTNFHHYHVLIRKLISKTYRGGKFVAFTFTNGLSACIEGELQTSLRNPMALLDDDGNLPLHVALSTPCDTNLGVTGERKLIKFLLQANPTSVLQPSSTGENPLRLCIRNGWPVYDIIISYYPIEYKEPTSNTKQQTVIHDILSGTFHKRFGISGARRIVRSVLHHSPVQAEVPDLNGRLAIHHALEYGWPCYDLIVRAAPTTLEIKDPTSGLFPFHIAACTHKFPGDINEFKTTNTMQLSSVFEVIREAPQLLDSFISSGTTQKRNIHQTSDPLVDDSSIEFKRSRVDEST